MSYPEKICRAVAVMLDPDSAVEDRAAAAEVVKGAALGVEMMLNLSSFRAEIDRELVDVGQEVEPEPWDLVGAEVPANN